MTIEQVDFIEFRSLKAASLRLGPLTALVGSNATGKSTVLRGLAPEFVSLSALEVWQRMPGRTPGRIVHMTNGNRFFVGGVPQGTSGTHGAAAWVRQHFHLDVNALRQPNRVTGEVRLHERGSNLANVFATLPRKVQSQIAEEFCRLVPVFADVDVRPSDEEGSHRIVLQDRWRSEIWYKPSDVSDGSMLMLAFALLPHQTAPPDLITVEEPEHGLHQYLLQQLVTLLRGLATGTVGPRSMGIGTPTPRGLPPVATVRAAMASRNG